MNCQRGGHNVLRGEISPLDNRASPPLDYVVCEKTRGADYLRTSLKSEET
jgi:hypothetical protein